MKNIKKISLLVFFALTNSLSHAEVADGVLEKYKKNNNNVFVCLGIYSCVSLARAMNAHFTEIQGIDEDEVLVQHAKIIFPYGINNNPYHITNYHIHYGSLAKLESVIAQIQEPITFLLGNHFPDVDEVRQNTILQELEIIKKHPIKTHTILIDYIHHAGTARFGNVTLESIKEKLLEINHNYKFAFEKGGHLEDEQDAILVAYVK